jgi:formamidopyrimidine-DNA glycosylase
MPELPEVQTTVSGLNRVATGLVITDVWTEYNSPYYHGKDSIKDPEYFKYFKKTIKNSKITSVTRRAKNILIHLSNGHTILIHMKMTGHVMYGNYNRKDPFNQYIRLIFYLSI